MTIASIRAWYGQVTTGAGFMLLAPTLLGVLMHQLSLTQALPALAAGLVGLIWPENRHLMTAVENGVTRAVAAAPAAAATVETIVAAYRAGLQHGAAAAKGTTP